MLFVVMRRCVFAHSWNFLMVGIGLLSMCFVDMQRRGCVWSLLVADVCCKIAHSWELAVDFRL